MKPVYKRLEVVMKEGNLRVSDLARWFDRPHATVRGWANGTAVGGTAMDAAFIEARLTELERLIKRPAFPVPPNMSPRERITFMAQFSEA